MELRYKNVTWTIPFLVDEGKFTYSVEEYLKNFDTKVIEKNCINILSDKNDFYDIAITLNFAQKNNSLQVKIDEKKFNPALLYNENFSKILKDLNKHSISTVVTNDYQRNYIKHNFPNINIIPFSKTPIQNEFKYYKAQIDNGYERIILNPHYVKGKFLKDASKYSDLSVFEVYADYVGEKDDYSLVLNNTDMEKLTDAGIKHFRIYENNQSLSNVIECLFNYIFVPDALSIYNLTQIIDEKYFINYVKNRREIYEEIL